VSSAWAVKSDVPPLKSDRYVYLTTCANFLYMKFTVYLFRIESLIITIIKYSPHLIFWKQLCPLKFRPDFSGQISILMLVSVFQSQFRDSCLRHELSSFARTLGSWVRIPLDAWMSVCVYSVFVLFSV
jgi:hypothetical protein